MLRIACGCAVVVLAIAAAQPALACAAAFASPDEELTYYRGRLAQAHDVVVGEVLGVIAVPSPADPRRMEGDATIAVQEVLKGSRSPGDRIVAPVVRSLDGPACGWAQAGVGGVYTLYLAFDVGRGEYSVLDAVPRPRGEWPKH